MGLLVKEKVNFFQLVRWDGEVLKKSFKNSSIPISLGIYQEIFWQHLFYRYGNISVTDVLEKGRFSVIRSPEAAGNNSGSNKHIIFCFLCLLIVPPLVMLIVRVCFRLSATRFHFPERESPHIQKNMGIKSPEVQEPQTQLTPVLEPPAKPEGETKQAQERPSLKDAKKDYVKAVVGDDLSKVQSALLVIKSITHQEGVHLEEDVIIKVVHPEIFRYLVEESNEKIVTNLFFKLIQSDHQKKEQFITLLLEKDPTLAQSYDRDGLTGMHYASLLQNQRVYALLLNHAAPQPSRKIYSLQADYRLGIEQVISAPIGLLPIEIREYFDHFNAANWLLAHAIGEEYQPDSRYPLPWGKTGTMETVCSYLNKKYLNKPDRHGITLLHYAALLEKEEMIKRLLALGADNTPRDIRISIDMKCKDYRYKRAVVIKDCIPTTFKLTLLTKEMVLFSWIDNVTDGRSDPLQGFVLPEFPLSATLLNYLASVLKNNLERWFSQIEGIDEPMEIESEDRPCSLLHFVTKDLKKFIDYMMEEVETEQELKRSYRIFKKSITRSAQIIFTLIKAGANPFLSLDNQKEGNGDLSVSDYESLMDSLRKTPEKLRHEHVRNLMQMLSSKKQELMEKELNSIAIFPAVLERIIAEYAT